MADRWAEEIQRNGCPCFHAAREILRSLGGLNIQEHSPAAALYFLERCQGRRERLKALGLAGDPRRFTAAS